MLIATIASISYLAPALVALRSARRHQPCDLLLLLIDGELDQPTAEAAGIRVISLADLGDPVPLGQMARYYSKFEFANALKPWLHAHIARTTTADRWCFVDADTWFLGEITEVTRLLDAAPVLLTSHTARSGNSRDDVIRELGLCRFGLSNGGCLAMRRSPEADAFVAWWMQRLVAHGRRRPDEGEFVDQKWLDVAQSCLPGVRSCRIPGVNIGHWNLHELEVRDGVLCEADGTPILLAHFSNVSLHGERANVTRMPVPLDDRLRAFERLSHDYAATVAATRIELQGRVRQGPVMHRPLGPRARKLVLDSLHGAANDDHAYDRAIAALPRVMLGAAGHHVAMSARHLRDATYLAWSSLRLRFARSNRTD